MIQTFTIQKATPSQNETDRMHWAKRRLVAKEWALLIQEQIALLGITRATGKRCLTVDRIGKKALDEGNLAGGLKGIIDELVKFGLLIDDDPKHMKLQVSQDAPAPGQKPHTIFTLGDM